ncbi:autotransporter outer membrane beta-barrel domain-containing protein [Aeromonas taiwanensis]|uniref:autotransporter outer membrane beta-barrel domain-containing protein n=2 Tax=Aeromonas taiwanensis TaxID=633417 RepID=UPI000B2C09B2|nr:autotransporter outer membrane beta-barrel domain-containing protein [Aeromonas taiwanensis]
MSLTESRMPARGPGCPLSLVAWSMAMSLYGINAAADPAGRLVFLGWTADQQHSVWLSAISPGQFEVESAKQNQIYDSWQQDRRGLHLTLSPEVQNGGTHKLYAYDDGSGKRVLLDTDNQQPGHFTFPDHFTPPSGPILPPQGMMPTRPGSLLPDRPGGTQPPIGAVPPQGVMPTRPGTLLPNRPGGTQPPTGAVPPQGMMPTRPGSLLPDRPGGTQPPIGAVPPQGMMPTRPGSLLPDRPGGTQPPIGAVPPQGVMPTRPGTLLPNRPGGTQPPIGAVPPQGVMPTRPGTLLPNRPGGVQPPQGMMPTRPGSLLPDRPGGTQPPTGAVPPQGMMPTRPGSLLPDRPGGTQPPIGTVPPQGVMPTRPGGVQPPIGTVPPQGVMPTRPGGVQPPIGTVPPQGTMPTRPGSLLPDRPGGTQPPIGTVPPQGVMPTRPGGLLPERPGGTQPPIGTVPPQGMMPTRPGGLLPDRPGGTQPPIGTVPPQGMMPTRPPLGERPTITLPGRVELPAVLPGRVTAGQQASERALDERTLCVMPDERDRLPAEQRDHYPDCPFSRVELAAGQVAAEEPPAAVQPAERRWNLWADEVYYDISDHRHGLDISGLTNVFSLGADTRLDNRLILGFSISRVDSRVDAFNGGMQLAAWGYNLGPYLAYPLSESWMLDGSLVYGWMDNTQELLFLSGDYGSTSFGGSLGAIGQYFWSETSVRPRLAINYSHDRSDGYRMEGDYRGLAVRLARDSDSDNQGNLTGTVEFSSVYYTRQGRPLMPYGELGLDYGFERPNDGYILTGDLSSARTDPLSGTVRLGVRTLIGSEATLTTSAGYTSIGQDGLNIWEWRINLSKPF